MAKERPDFDQLARLEQEVIRAFADQGVVRVEHVIAFSPPFDYSLWLGTATDDERDRLRNDAGLETRLREIARQHGPYATFRLFTIESQETVDREYEGNWFYRLR